MFIYIMKQTHLNKTHIKVDPLIKTYYFSYLLQELLSGYEIVHCKPGLKEHAINAILMYLHSFIWSDI